MTEERIGVLELVWMTVLADDRVDTLESQLMRRLAGLLFVSDVDSGLATKPSARPTSSTPKTTPLSTNLESMLVVLSLETAMVLI